jgi:hypothetical protein
VLSFRKELVIMNESSEAGATRPEMSDQVKTIFKQLFDEQASIKQQEWKITNYAVLLIAAAFTLKTHYKVNTCLVPVVVWVTFIIGSGLLLRIQWDLGRYRNRIDGLHKAYFTVRADRHRRKRGGQEKPRCKASMRTGAEGMGIYFGSDRRSVRWRGARFFRFGLMSFICFLTADSLPCSTYKRVIARTI